MTIGIGPFVIAPAVERKMGLSGFSELTLNATAWKSAYWAKEKGLFAKVFESITELDTEVDLLSEKLASTIQELYRNEKNPLERNSTLGNTLEERAAISGNWSCLDLHKKALAKFKK